MPLYKEYFHKHSYDDIKYRNLPLNFKIRFAEAFGYYHEKVYTQTQKGRLRDYRTPWILLEDTPENARRFAWVFYNFNIYTTLNYYRENQVTKECYVDLAFDFDAPQLGDAWRDAMRMSEFLQDKQVSYQLFFSGKKGFHIVIGYRVFGQEYQENNHLINKEMAKLMIQETGPLPTMDMAIYSSRRQFRFPNSLHSGSGLFKIPIIHEELASGVDPILKLAEKKRDSLSLSSPSYSNYLHHIYLQAKQNLDRLPKYDVPEVDLSVLGGSRPPSYEYFRKHPQNNLSRLFFQKQSVRTESGTVCLENFLLINKLEKQTRKPIIILDATGKKQLYEKLFEREVIEYAPQVKLENEIIQVYSSSNSKRSLSNPRHFQRYMEAVKKLVVQEPYTLVMSKEIYEDKIAVELASISPHAKAAHFFGIRGSNEFQDLNQVIIFGTPQICEDELKKYASMLHYSEPRLNGFGYLETLYSKLSLSDHGKMKLSRRLTASA